MLKGLLLCAAVAALGMAIQRREGGGAPAAGVPLPIAEERAAQLKDVRYELDFTIPAAVTEPIKGAQSSDSSWPLPRGPSCWILRRLRRGSRFAQAARRSA